HMRPGEVDSLLNRPSLAKSPPKKHSRLPREACQFGQGNLAASIGHHDQLLTGSPVVQLLLPSRPPAVTGFVVSIVVDAIDRMVRTGSPSHVSQKRLEAILPALAHPYPSTPVVLIGSVALVAAAVAHPLPDDVLPRMTLAVRAIANCQDFAIQTPARSGPRQVSLIDSLLLPAVTSAQPYTPRAPDKHKTAVTLTRTIPSHRRFS